MVLLFTKSPQMNYALLSLSAICFSFSAAKADSRHDVFCVNYAAHYVIVSLKCRAKLRPDVKTSGTL